MTGDQNIEQSREDGKSERPEEVHSNISPKQIITPAELSNQASVNPDLDQNLQIRNKRNGST